jgi:hypothetical protein
VRPELAEQVSLFVRLEGAVEEEYRPRMLARSRLADSMKRKSHCLRPRNQAGTALADVVPMAAFEGRILAVRQLVPIPICFV